MALQLYSCRYCWRVTFLLGRLALAGQQAGYPVWLAANLIQGVAEGAMNNLQELPQQSRAAVEAER